MFVAGFVCMSVCVRRSSQAKETHPNESFTRVGLRKGRSD